MQRLVVPYRISDSAAADICIHIREDLLQQVRERYSQLTDDEWEYILSGFAFSRSLLDYDGFCLHASAVALDRRAVLFSAPCGTGKSTHTALWRRYFGQDRTIILNDDKPALRWMDGHFQVFGTPWSGKSGLNVNENAPLHAIVFLEQAKENRICRLSVKESVQMLAYQSFRPGRDIRRTNRLLELFDALLQETPVYRMGCTISEEAVKTAHHQLFGKEEKE